MGEALPFESAMLSVFVFVEATSGLGKGLPLALWFSKVNDFDGKLVFQVSEEEVRFLRALPACACLPLMFPSWGV